MWQNETKIHAKLNKICSFIHSTDALMYWLIYWFIQQHVTLMAVKQFTPTVNSYVPIDWLIDQLILFDWFIRYSESIYPAVHSVTFVFIDWLIEWLIDWLLDWLIDWSIDWSIDWLMQYWLLDWLIDAAPHDAAKSVTVKQSSLTAHSVTFQLMPTPATLCSELEYGRYGYTTNFLITWSSITGKLYYILKFSFIVVGSL